MVGFWFGFLIYIDSPRQDDLGLSGPPSDQGASGRARTRDRNVPVDLRTDSLSTVPPRGEIVRKRENAGQMMMARAAEGSPAELRPCWLTVVPPLTPREPKSIGKDKRK
ncbi:hypothetical protein PoB_004693500 [Plakobranchus ocellatus]|uniref:Uncharacterized protein n=1 Tax=Plakobranchus ocellatus TaxID=259542 RepID=A0AAV4BN19_9GAST|nr:hypothetical protein PoB_004693500 [Plakobranchus ocellatus]